MSEDDAGSGRYRRGAEIARGGMGRVVEAEDAVLGRVVALKETLELDADARARFEREVRITARLEHPSIVPVYDAGRTAAGLPFYVMRRLTGRPLDQIIRASAGLDDRLTYVPNLLSVLDAVGHAHRRGVIHRDLKPANVLIGDLGETVVIDWGLAKVVGEAEMPLGAPLPVLGDAATDATVAGAVIGTPGFMAPEQVQAAPVDARSDVFALGATLYHLLAGVPPYAGGGATAILERTVTESPPVLADVVPGVPRELETIVAKAMARDPAARYADAAAMGEDLRRFLSGRLVAAHHYSPRERLFRFIRRNRTVLSVVAAAVVALAAVGTLSLRRILADRDRIASARATAESRRAEAEATARELRTLADGLLVDQARVDLATDPTLSIALLKRLPPDSAQWPAARAIVAEARARGIAFALPGPPGTVYALDIAPDDRHLLTIGLDGTVRIHDLVAKTSHLIAQDMTPLEYQLRWAGPDLARLELATHQLALISPDDGHVVRTVSNQATVLAAAIEGPIGWIEPDGTVQFLRSGADQPERVGTMPGANGIAISPAGSWVVVETPRPKDQRPTEHAFHRLADGSWRLVLEMPEPPGDLVFAYNDSLGAYAADDHTIVELDLHGPTPHEVRRFAIEGRMSTLGYAGTHLWTMQSRSDRVMYYDHSAHQVGRVVPALAAMQRVSGMPAAVGNGILVIAGNLEGGRFVITAPDEPPIEVFATDPVERVAARIGCPWVVGTSGNRVLVWSLVDLTPRTVDTNGANNYVHTLGPHTFAASDPAIGMVYDTRTDRFTNHDSIAGTRGMSFDADLGVLVRFQDDDRVEVIDVETWTKRTVTIPVDQGAILDADTLLVESGGALAAVDVGTGGRRELGRFDGDVAEASSHHGWAVLYGGDTIVRTDGHVVETAHSGHGAIRAADPAPDGTVYLVADNAMLRWPRGSAGAGPAPAPAVIATLTVQLDSIITRGTDVVMGLASDKSAWRFDVATGALGQILPTVTSWPELSRDGNCVVAARDGAIVIADLVGHAYWTIPTGDAFVAAPGPTCDQIFAATTHSMLELWDVTLPYATDELRAWIDARTNARASASQGVIEWVLPPP